MDGRGIARRWAGDVGASVGRLGVIGVACTVASPSLADEVPLVASAFFVPATQADHPAPPDIMGTLALQIRPSPTSNRWERLMHASVAQPRLEALAAGARNLSPDEQIAFVQAAVSDEVRDLSPADGCADDGYWAPAQETLVRGAGDCVDVAIAKMEALRMLGMPPLDMYLTTGRVGAERAEEGPRETAGLLVRSGGHFWLLPDWARPAVRVDTGEAGAGGFVPVITYGVGMSWVHGRPLRMASASAHAEAIGAR